MEVKSVGTFPVILLKPATPPLPPHRKLNLEQKCFFWPQHCWGSGGDDEMNPKPNKKLSLGAGPNVTIAWKGFFTQSHVLLSSIVGTTLQCQNAMALLFQLYIAFTHSLGYPCPDNFNPADFFVRTLAIKPGNEENCRNRVKVGTALFFYTLHSDYFILFIMPVTRPYFLQNLLNFCE